MLDQFRRNSRSFIIWILFGIIIAVFIISFGPASGQLTCGAPAAYAGHVGDDDISASSWRFAVNGLGIGSDGTDPKEQAQRHQAIDLLIERELLAQGAAEAGFKVSTEMVNHAISHGDFYLLGFQQQAPYFDADGAFSYDILEDFIRRLGLSEVDQYIEQQRLELAANFMRTSITKGVQVSEAEIRDAYVRENTTVELSYQKLYPTAFASAIDLADGRLSVYLAGHLDEVKAYYDGHKRLYSDVGKQVHVRRIFIADEDKEQAAGDKAAAASTAADDKATDAKDKADGDKADGDKADAAKDKAAAAAHTAAKKTADRALRQVRGQASFADVARKMSDDKASAALGGDLGWRKESALPNAAVAKAIAPLSPGAISDVIEVPGGFVIAKIEGRREGDLSLDDVKLEIARELASKDVARAYAEAIIAKASAGTPLLAITPADIEPAIKAAGLPIPAGVTLPKVDSVGPIPHPLDNTIPGIGKSEAIVTAAFETLADGKVLPEPQEVAGAFVVVRLTAKTKADLDKLDERKDSVRHRLRIERGAATVAAWVKARCTALAESGDLVVDARLLAGSDTAPRVAYVPCQTLSFQTAAQQLQSQMLMELRQQLSLSR